jgi:hypothetical protein
VEMNIEVNFDLNDIFKLPIRLPLSSEIIFGPVDLKIKLFDDN